MMQEGDNVVVDLNGEKQSFVRLREGGTVMVSGAKCSMDPLIGAPFGASFLVSRDSQLERVSSNPHDAFALATSTDKVRLPIKLQSLELNSSSAEAHAHLHSITCSIKYLPRCSDARTIAPAISGGS